ncbi:MAG: hypothetical protein SXQ77_02990, partial [Halobacteria archaeon]|nr:hypothetical protein [Halobacteria archaeon]
MTDGDIDQGKETESMDYQIDHSAKGFRYYRNAVERHWNPHEIELEADRKALINRDFERGEEDFDNFRRGLALFGAGEES